MKANFLGSVYMDGKIFTHPNSLMGFADNSKSKVVKQLRINVHENIHKDYINKHDWELHILDDRTKQTEIIKLT